MSGIDTENAGAKAHWDALHAQSRFRPRYPSDAVVRFVMGSFGGDGRGKRAIDIGVGGGRHTKFLCELGFETSGIDISGEGLRRTSEWLETLHLKADLRETSMTNLPFPSDSFDAAVSWGVFYYADCAGMHAAIHELYRVLRVGGMALVMTRRTADYRFDKGERLEPRTVRLTGDDTNEKGSIMHFLSEEDVPSYFSDFAKVDFEWMEFTFGGRAGVNSDWIITVQK